MVQTEETIDSVRQTKLAGRLDHVAATVSPFLTVIVIGLAILTLTSFSVMAIKDALAPITRVGCPAPNPMSS
jgi:hypothetical protein